MLEILLLLGSLTPILLGLAKHKGRRRSYVRPLRVSEDAALSTLGAGTMGVFAWDDTVSEKTYLLSLEAIWAMSEHTASEGAITVGVAHSDYTSTEINEWFVATSAWDTGNLVAQEQNRRKIRQVGVFPGFQTSEVLNDGKSIKTPLRFIVETGQSLQTWAFNHDTSVLTTGSIISVDGKVWSKAA